MRTILYVDGFNLYYGALKAYLPNLTIHYGTFQANEVTLPATTGRRFHDVIRTEEKGSDVNLAVHLVNDAWLNAYECAVVVSNDSDLAEGMKLVRKHHPQKVLGLIAPLRATARRATHRLRIQAHFVKSVRSGDAAKAQLPDLIPGTRIHRPVQWR